MAKIPVGCEGRELDGLTRVHAGKVRDTYRLPVSADLSSTLNLVVASDRVSIFDFVLPALVPQKGEVLNALNHYWRMLVLPHGSFPGDYIVSGKGIDRYLPENLRKDPDLQKRAAVVTHFFVRKLEAVVRGYITGSAFGQYRKGKDVQGHRLPMGLRDGDRLPWPIFTPTTKEENGHDVPMDIDDCARQFTHVPERIALQLYSFASEFALKRGLVLADTKFEFSLSCALVDECLTCDSSRYWDLADWGKSRMEGRSPVPLDKQLVREWGKSVGIHERDPANPEDVEWAHGLTVPEDVIRRTAETYRYLFWRLTGWKLERYQRESLGLSVQDRPVRVEVVIGSESDLPQARIGLSAFGWFPQADVRVSVISCHRNPDALRQFAAELPDDRVVVAGAGMAAALPGVLAAHLRQAGKGNPVIGVAFAGRTREDGEAARLSIERLPDGQVVLGKGGKAHFGAQGFSNALRSAIEDEFMPKAVKVAKPAKLNIDWKKF